MSLEGRVCVVTGAGRGLGREYARFLARHGASVVVNDLGSSRVGDGADAGPAQAVVDELNGGGGRAVANVDDVSTWSGATRLVEQAVDTFGRLDVLVNNAGILRDRMLATMSEAEWDDVVRIHLRGTFCVSRQAVFHWRDRSKQGLPNDGRLVNTTSSSGLYANVGQANYGAAKSAIATFTLIAAQEVAPYGVTANAIAPGAITRLTEDLEIPEDRRANFGADRVAPLVAWLASPDSADVTGQVFECSGRVLAVVDPWRRGPATDSVPTSVEETGSTVRQLLAAAPPRTMMADVATSSDVIARNSARG